MAMILQFRARAGRDEAEDLAQRQAQIIIFPGVRRERHGEAKPVRRRSKPKRDRLELPD